MAPNVEPNVAPNVAPNVEPNVELNVEPNVAQNPPIASSGPVDRERFAQFFPEDRDLVSGIGSLMG